MALLQYADVMGAVTNLVALEKLITADVSAILKVAMNTEAYPYMRQESPVYPKWLNGISEDRPDLNGINENLEAIGITMEIQLGKRTEGQDGLLEQQLYVWIPYTLAMLRASPLLTSQLAQNKPLGLLGAAARLSKPLMPGDIIAAQFVCECAFSTTNSERDY